LLISEIFSGITGSRGLYASSIVQKAVVEVNEEGVEAAAASGLEFTVRSAFVSEPYTFHCNRPFMFVIHDQQTDTILFMGRVSNPTNK